jgi:hypothetical protein
MSNASAAATVKLSRCFRVPARRSRLVAEMRSLLISAHLPTLHLRVAWPAG